MGFYNPFIRADAHLQPWHLVIASRAFLSKNVHLGQPRYLFIPPAAIETFRMLFNLSIGRVLALAIALTSSVASADKGHEYSGPKSIQDFRKCHPYHNPPKDHRPKIYIRDSKNDTDDISAEFLKGLKKANYGGTLVLPKGKTFVIGKKLDLTFLNNVQVNLEGKILVSPRSHSIQQTQLLTLDSSQTILPTGKRTTSTIHSKSQSPFGSGVERISRSLALESSTEMAKPGTTGLPDWKFW